MYSKRGGKRHSWEPVRPRVAVCRFFALNKCKYGNTCKFMHCDASTDNKTSNPPALDDRVSQFKRLVNQHGRGDRFYEHSTTQSVFALGLDVLDTVQDAGLKQEVITTLASEEGLSCIRHVASNRIPQAMATGANEKVKLWETEVCPLLRLAVHNTVVNSTLLEEKVAAIHSFLVGVGGTRLTAWFDLAVELAESPQLPPEVSCIGLAELSLLVLSTLLGSGTSQIVNDSFRHYSMRLSAVVTNAEPSRPEDTFCKLQASQYADYIDRRLKIGEDIPGLRQATPSGPVQLSAFQLQRDLPGHLSADGPRHDNDHADITKISILPTPDEIRSTRSEYLPVADPTSWHHHGIRGRLDREFRLLREDTVGQLRDVVRTELDNLQQNKDKGTAFGPGPRGGKDSIQYCVYENAVIIDVGFEQRSGAEFLVRFRQPANRHRQSLVKPAEDSDASKKQRRDWWTFQAKKRLQPGGLVCAIDAQGSVNFFTVSDSTMRTSSDVKRWREMDSSSDPNQEIKYTLADDPQHAFVRLGFKGIEGQSQLAYGLSWFLKSRINRASAGRLRDGQQLRILVEFPGILLDSFLHTLRALQSGTEKLNIPMSNLIAPEQIDVEGVNPQPKDVAPPKYAQKPGFVFDMSSLTAANETLQHSIRRPLTSEEVCDKTRLDRTQSVALLEALSRSLALVQGPPGTGKTFAGVEILKVLLHNQKKAELGPIVIVCYTNHALDQILEHILDSGTPANILRMGGQSKSERLKNLNLRDVALNVERTKVEREMLWSSRKTLNFMVNQLEQLFGSLSVSTREDAIVRFLSRYDIEVYRELFGRRGADDDSGDEDGFTTVNRQKPSAIIHRWRNGGDVEFGPAATGRRLSMLTLDERNTLYEKWQTESFTLIQDDIERVYIDYVAAKRSYDKARQEADLRCLEAANIVGMTTTGLAKNHNLLKHIKSKVLLCEEAGEVLEAHMLTSFLPSIEHAILIGDHQQLRPQVQNYDLSIENRGGAQFAFDKSLFERLVSPRAGEAKIPYSTLSTQRRMHSSISALIRAPLYPSLEDGPNVHLYPEVTGMTRRLFWLDHQNWEDGAVGGYKSTEASGTSRTNEFEVQMTVALVSHLFKQGTYSGGDIAVLTPYLGQMMLLRQRLSLMFELTFNDRDAADLEAADAVRSEAELTDRGDSAQADRPFVPAKTTLLNSVRIATVDNFQGEEAKVVVISLVRSNKNRQCGFLRTSNRINVLLSRARHGMYIIGNGDTCTGIPMWRDVMSALQCGNNMGPELPLQCPRHPERTFLASLPDHFVQFAPDGGCQQPCDKRLACGHSCIGRCHSDVIHAAVKCLEPCPRSLNGCIHACPRPCGESCVTRCQVELKDTMLDLPCGHTLTNPFCWQAQRPNRVVCLENVKRKIPGCAHELTLPCHTKVTDEKFVCKAPSTATSGPMAELSAPTTASAPRHADVSTELASMLARRHATATRHAPLARRRVMSDAVIRDARGLAMNHVCPVPKANAPRAARTRLVPCHALHRVTGYLARSAAQIFFLVAITVSLALCPSVCGEACPSVRYCQECGADDVLDQEVDFITMATYREINLGEDPCIFPVCGHILTMSSMDGVMDMAKHYTMTQDTSGLPRPVAIAASSSPFDMKEVKVCPHCRGSLRDVARYGRIVRRAVLDESTKRFINWARQKHNELALQLTGHKGQLEVDKEMEGKKAKLSIHHRAEQVYKKKFFAGKGRSALMVELLLSTDLARHHQQLVQTRNDISQFAAKVATDEQPFQRVAELVTFAHNRRLASGSEPAALDPAPHHFEFDESVLQTGSSLQAAVLLMRCDVLALEYVVFSLEKATLVDKLHSHIRGGSSSSSSSGNNQTQDAASYTLAIQTISKAIKTNRFTVLFNEFESTTVAAKSAKYTKQEVEGYICSTHLCIVLSRLLDCIEEGADAENGETVDEPSTARWVEGGGPSGRTGPGAVLSRTELKERATQHVATARAVFQTSPSAHDLFGPEVDRLEEALENLAEYQPVTSAEMQAVYKAMASEFNGSGHWYTCVNGHPFTVGECGMPMEQARCNECGAPVGGRNHTNAEGVVAATEIEELGRDMGRMAV
ncbi:NF-X1 finger and helicase protein [Sporothrix schenckii 1099-18]|uniref:NF-X1 finger and helicase protein n=1 Tax=Sporothrix schenckii 1099-18 TaxID=1397361 RepID=A0A0F2MCV1_SPOSC|nr:NF-X1 finger and helicase protein [Sporothrix schenckii 1099-18]KJR87462.1 NF-X1 finger and helicase protein [Sporothrix schenckii 1099-18]